MRLRRILVESEVSGGEEIELWRNYEDPRSWREPTMLKSSAVSMNRVLGEIAR